MIANQLNEDNLIQESNVNKKILAFLLPAKRKNNLFFQNLFHLSLNISPFDL